MSGHYDRRRFIARLLLLSASQAGGGQGSTGNCACFAANMTFDKLSNRDKQRKQHTPFVVDSGATLHCINDISLFDSIDQDHPKIKLRVANGKVIEAQAVGTVLLGVCTLGWPGQTDNLPVCWGRKVGPIKRCYSNYK